MSHILGWPNRDQIKVGAADRNGTIFSNPCRRHGTVGAYRIFRLVNGIDSGRDGVGNEARCCTVGCEAHEIDLQRVLGELSAITDCGCRSGRNSGAMQDEGRHIVVFANKLLRL